MGSCSRPGVPERKLLGLGDEWVDKVMGGLVHRRLLGDASLFRGLRLVEDATGVGGG